jgi:parallel beta-helix repeat protein
MVKGIEAIVIKADGSIEPSTAPIGKDGNLYFLTGNIINTSIIVERDNIIIDGASYTVQGTGAMNSIGIYLAYRNNVTIKNVQVRSFFDGIQLFQSSHCTITNCNITENGNSGIRLPESSNNNITGNIVTNNNHTGIQLYKSSNNLLTENYVANNRNYGIDFAQSSNNILRNNVLVGNRYNFAMLYCAELSHFINDVDETNTVNGKPIYYLINKKDMVIDPSTYPNVGYLALVNSTNITVKELTLENNGQGILLAYTNNSKITYNNIINNECGVKLCYSFGNTISGNFIKNGHWGFWLEYAANNQIAGNNYANITTQIYDATPETTPPPSSNGTTSPPTLPPWIIGATIIILAAITLTLLLRPKTKPRRKTSKAHYRA